jgi:hypothetical protein
MCRSEATVKSDGLVNQPSGDRARSTGLNGRRGWSLVEQPALADALR